MLQRSSSDRSGKRGEKKSRRRDGDSKERSRYGDVAGVRKKSHFLEGIKEVNTGDVEFLRKFVTEHGKIIPSRLTGATAKQQRKIKLAIRRTRVMGFLP
jgi:small subunit ribosomal protein S18